MTAATATATASSSSASPLPRVLHSGPDYFSFVPYHPDSPTSSPASSEQDAYSPFSSPTSSPASSESSFISESYHCKPPSSSRLELDFGGSAAYVEDWDELDSPSPSESEATLVDDEEEDEYEGDLHRPATSPFPVTPPEIIFTLTLPPPRRKSPSSASPPSASSDRVEIASPSGSATSSSSVSSASLRLRERSVHIDTPWADAKEDGIFAFGLGERGEGLLPGVRVTRG